MILPIVLYSISLFATPPVYNRLQDTLPFQFNWGPYIVKIKSKGDTQKVLILNTQGKLLKEIQSGFITRVETIELTGKAPRELHISCFSGGAYCCGTDLYFTMEKRLRNMLIFRGEELGVEATVDVNHDGRPIIVVHNPVLGDFSENHFHPRHYALVTILRWQRNRFVDVTRYYPENSLIQADSLKKQIWNDLHDPPAYIRDWYITDLIAAYYANMLAVRQKVKAKHWLRTYLPKHLYQWLHSHQKELQMLVNTAKRRRGYVSQSNHLKINLLFQ